MKKVSSFLFAVLAGGLVLNGCSLKYQTPDSPQVSAPSGPPILTSAQPLTYIGQWGTSGTGNGQFAGRPYGICADSVGNVYVLDRVNHRIQKFDSAGNYLSQWGTPGN